MSDYTNLFPFEKVPKGTKIAIYGAGFMGFEYLKQMMITKYAEIVCFFDRNYEKYGESLIPVIPAEKLKDVDFDYVVLAFQTTTYNSEIIAKLVDMGIEQEKIVCGSSRPDVNTDFFLHKDAVKDIVYAYEKSEVSIAVKLSEAIGDNIVRKKILECFAEIVPNCAIDIYSPAADTFLPSLYLGFKNVANFINGGGAYARQSHNYNVALTIANFIIILDELHIENLTEKYTEFCRRMLLLKKRCDEQEVNFSMPVYTHFMKNIKRGKNYYTSYDYDGVFDIKDKNVHIRLNDAYCVEYAKFNLKNYITVNYGNGISVDKENIVAKQWPKKNFEMLIKMLKAKYKNMEIVQLGGGNAEKLSGADKYILGESLEIVKYILKNSTLHIDIEGGLVHLATQLGTKCIVLFGPTQEEFFGYAENINIRFGACRDCYGMYKDISRCARGMEKPECMYSITPELVMEKASEYLSTL